MNKDGTITFIMGLDGQKGNWSCPCHPIKTLKPYDFPLTYCGCCGAHVKYTHEFALDVKLNLKEIVSSKANSNGEKPCKFIYEVIQDITSHPNSRQIIVEDFCRNAVLKTAGRLTPFKVFTCRITVKRPTRIVYCLGAE